MTNTLPRSIHLHLVSDATGETLISISKAVMAQYDKIEAQEHMHMLVRSTRQMTRTLQKIEADPGPVLHTVTNPKLAEQLEQRGAELKVPVISALDGIIKIFDSYFGATHKPMISGQHALNESYFRRIEALNFTMEHDDGRLPTNIDDADIVLLGISRTSKTPTGIYLAQRGYKTTNVPLVPSLPFPQALLEPHNAFVACLIASPDRISEVRQHRSQMLSDRELDNYIDRVQISEEISYSRRICARHGWPVIDVTRRSVEETAATILQLMHDRAAKKLEEDKNEHKDKSKDQARNEPSNI